MGEKVLFRTRSAFNRITVTEDSENHRSLCFGDRRIPQSVIKVGAPGHLLPFYPQVMIAGFGILERFDRALILGLGGGVIPRFLRARLPDLQIDVVEIDPVVVEVAARFFGVTADDRLSVHVDDARRFLEHGSDRYDAIILDVAGLQGMPFPFKTLEFLQSARRALTEHGLLTANVWSRWSNPHYDGMVLTYRAVFAHLFIASVSGLRNQIFFASSQSGPLACDDFESHAHTFSTRLELPIDLADCLRTGLRNGADEIASGEVLRDQPARR